MKYTMNHYSGGGTEYFGGVWDVTFTEKTVIFKLLEKPFYESAHMQGITKVNRQTAPIEEWDDGSFTFYPKGCGIPHVFEEVKS